MSLPDISNEQKLTYIYQTLKAQETRRKRKAWFWILKWVLIVSFIMIAYSYREWIFDRSIAYVKQTIDNRIKKINEEQRIKILQGIQQLLPPSLENTLRDVQKSLIGTGNISLPSLAPTSPQSQKTTPSSSQKKNVEY